MADYKYRDWHIIRAIKLGAPAATVWGVVGGFFNIHTWHPDIDMTELVPNQTEMSAVRRLLTFPGQPKTTEQLIFMDNEGYHYRYKWHEGAWGEYVQDYVADIRVFSLDLDLSSVMQWSSTFRCDQDAVSDFYRRGFRSLQERFPEVR